MARLDTANDIINRVAVEVGLTKDNDPVSSADETFIQFTELLTAAGQEMVELHEWQILRGKYQVLTGTTAPVDPSTPGTFALPDDFSYMIDQTGWEHSNRVAIGGPLSPQDWTYLEGRDLVSQSIYASFRLVENNFDIFPQDPVPDGLDIHFEYIKRNWVMEASGNVYRDTIGTGSDVVLFEPILIRKYLRVKWLSAKGFDTSDAKTEFENMFQSRTGRDIGAPILSASNNSRGFPFLHPYYNTADTGFGVP